MSATISFPGSDILFSTAPSLTVPRYSVLGLHNLGDSSGSSNSPAPSSGSSGVNPYQQSYDGIIAASNAYLQNSLLNGPPAVLPEYTAGGSASGFAQLSTTLASLKSGLGAGLFGGTGVNALA